MSEFLLIVLAAIEEGPKLVGSRAVEKREGERGEGGTVAILAHPGSRRAHFRMRSEGAVVEYM